MLLFDWLLTGRVGWILSSIICTPGTARQWVNDPVRLSSGVDESFFTLPHPASPRRQWTVPSRPRGVQLFIVTNAMKTVTRPTGLRAAQLQDSRYSTNANQPIEPTLSHEVPTRFHAAE